MRGGHWKRHLRFHAMDGRHLADGLAEEAAMAHRWAALGVVAGFLGFAYAPTLVRGQGTSPSQHDQHHVSVATGTGATATAESRTDMKAGMERMKANGAKLEALVEKMQAARGAA